MWLSVSRWARLSKHWLGWRGAKDNCLMNKWKDWRDTTALSNYRVTAYYYQAHQLCYQTTERMLSSILCYWQCRQNLPFMERWPKLSQLAGSDILNQWTFFVNPSTKGDLNLRSLRFAQQTRSSQSPANMPVARSTPNRPLTFRSVVTSCSCCSAVNKRGGKARFMTSASRWRLQNAMKVIVARQRNSRLDNIIEAQIGQTMWDLQLYKTAWHCPCARQLDLVFVELEDTV